MTASTTTRRSAPPLVVDPPPLEPAAAGGLDRRLRRFAGIAGWVLIAGIPVTMFAAFFFYPVGSLLGRGLAPGGTLDLSGLAEVAAKPRVQRIALFTVWQAAASEESESESPLS